MGQVIYDNSEGFILMEDEFGDICSNMYGEECKEFYNEGSVYLGNVEEEC